jgi:uncharacterized protein
MRVFWQLLAVATVAFIGGQAVAAADGEPWLTLVLGLATSVVAVLVYGWVVRRTEHRPLTEIPVQGAASAVGRGALVGAVLFAGVIAQLYFNGQYDVSGGGSLAGAAGLVGYMGAAAVTEELLFRGVLFRLIEKRAGTWVAMLLSGLLFGIYHLANPDASLWGAVAVAIEAGGMLTAAYIATRKLWVPIGLHFGWNFAAAGIFSTEVSGNGSTHGLLDGATSGPALLTGGDFGPEGSVYAVGFCVVTAVVFLLVARRRGHLMPSRGRAEQATALAKIS